MSGSESRPGITPAGAPRLPAGTRLGPYEIKAPLGAGGMGEVYRARDTRLDRDVAIKVMRGGRAVTPEAKARFEREARAVSALNHPNISALYDIGRQETPAGPVDYLVMELIEGENLADRLLRGPLPVEDLLRAAVPIADALDRAHRKGIVHRDLKPANIMLSKGGPKLLDFGLARPAAAIGSSGGDLSASPTMTRALTQEGAIIGTFQYMAPEQLEGKEADARSDLFAFGATLYEMATGRKAFEGTSQASLIAAIMNAKPQPMRSHQPLAPASLERVVATCLARDPDDRWQSAGDLKRELQWIAASFSEAAAGLSGAATGGAGVASTAAARAAVRRIHVTWAGLLVLSILVTAATGVRLRPVPERASGAPLLRAAIAPPAGARFNIVGDVAGPPVLSPDGRRVVFAAIDAAGNRLWVRSLDSLEARVLPGTEGAMYPFWSPDGRSIGFFTVDKLKRIDVDGGAVYTICGAVSPRGGAWAPDGTIVFGPTFDTALVKVPAGGGTPEPLTRLAQGKHTTHRWPQFLPDGRHFLFLAAHHEKPDSEDNGIYLGSLDGGEPQRVVASKSSAAYADGQLFYVQGNTLVAQPFDAVAGRIAGPAVPTAERVHLDRTTWRAVFSVGASTHSLVYMPASGKIGTRILVYDIASGGVETVADEVSQLNMNASDDGRRIAVEDQEGPRSDIWIYDIVDGSKNRLTFDPMDESSASWYGKDRVVFGANRPDGRYRIYEKSARGGAETLLFEWDDDIYPSDVSADGRWLLFNKGHFASRQDTDLYLLPLQGAKTPIPFAVSRSEETDGQFSPDGRWIAFTSSQSGQEEIYVAPRPAPGGTGHAGTASSGQWQISSGGGSVPRWTGDGRTIFYRRADNTTFAKVEVDGSGPAFHVGRPRDLPFHAYQNWSSLSYDVMPDGRKLIVASPGGDSASTMALISDWSAIVK
ncbi:MAG TPA: protein kinase [Candidatus Polarisedimenticolia bacterium]|nr:protein kinase [Candidatus Polarisedimenticolia bacterium]